MKLVSIGKFAEMAGVTPVTLRRMHQTGELIPHHVSKGGTRYYSLDQLQYFSKKSNAEKRAVGYCRVSTVAQKDDLRTQVENVKAYMCARGYQFEIIEDVGSGINYDKKGLQTLLLKIVHGDISRVVVLYKDRLVRFGFEMIEYLCRICDVEIEIIDDTSLSKEQELTEDLMQIVTVFANRLYGQRSKKTKRLIEGVRNNVDSSKNQTDSDA